jgi:hypothetical protein
MAVGKALDADVIVCPHQYTHQYAYLLHELSFCLLSNVMVVVT